MTITRSRPQDSDARSSRSWSSRATGSCCSRPSARRPPPPRRADRAGAAPRRRRSGSCDAAQGAKNELRRRATPRSCASARRSPSTVDMPSLLVQLDAAAAGTGIRFTKIATGDRVTSATAAGRRARRRPRGLSPARPALPRPPAARPPQSAPGGAAEAANNAQATANQNRRRRAVGRRPRRHADLHFQRRRAARRRRRRDATADGTPTAPPGLETVPLELEFVGNFFNLADFFHRREALRVARRTRTSS